MNRFSEALASVACIAFLCSAICLVDHTAKLRRSRLHEADQNQLRSIDLQRAQASRAHQIGTADTAKREPIPNETAPASRAPHGRNGKKMRAFSAIGASNVLLGSYHSWLANNPKPRN